MLRSIIDPSLGIGREERREVTRAAWGRWIETPRNAVVYSAALVAAMSTFFILPDLIEPLFGGRSWYFALIWIVVYLAIIAGVLGVARRWSYAPAVYAELRARGYDICARCGYALCELPAERDRCPECGAERVEAGGNG